MNFSPSRVPLRQDSLILLEMLCHSISARCSWGISGLPLSCALIFPHSTENLWELLGGSREGQITFEKGLCSLCATSRENLSCGAAYLFPRTKPSTFCCHVHWKGCGFPASFCHHHLLLPHVLGRSLEVSGAASYPELPAGYQAWTAAPPR